MGDQSRLESLKRAKLDASVKWTKLAALVKGMHPRRTTWEDRQCAEKNRQCAENEFHTCAEQLTKHWSEMYWREEAAKWYWTRAHGLTSDDLSRYHQVIWSWDRRPVDRDDKVEEDASFPYREDCYPVTDEHSGSFYTEDRWHPPMDGIPRNTGVPCLYAAAYKLGLSPPGYFVPVSQMHPERFTVKSVIRPREDETLFVQSGDSANVGATTSASSKSRAQSKTNPRAKKKDRPRIAPVPTDRVARLRIFMTIREPLANLAEGKSKQALVQSTLRRLPEAYPLIP